MIQQIIILPPLLCRGGRFLYNRCVYITGGELKHCEKQSSQERGIS